MYHRTVFTNVAMFSLFVFCTETYSQSLDGTNEPPSIINNTTLAGGSSSFARVVFDSTFWNAAGAGGSQDILFDPNSYVGNISNFNLTVNGSGLDYVYGGLTDLGNVISNNVTVSAGAVINKIAYGGYTAEGDAINNHITVSGTVNGNVNGAHIKTTGNVINNTITILRQV